MAQQLTVKAYLKRWNAERQQLESVDEIRRFAVDQDVATSFTYLLAKVTSVFPGLNNASISLYWRDVDNDMIAFSSDDELMEAVKNTTDGVLRVYITENQSAVPLSSGPLHYGVVCDGCEGDVRGIRNKCLVCPDYDLCNKCKTAGMHSEHEMMAIPQPLPMPEIHGPFVGSFGSFPPFVPPPVPPPPPPPMPQGPPGGGDAGGCDPDQVRRMTRRAWKRWYKETYGDDHKRKLKKEKKERKEQEKREKKQKKEKDQQTGAGTDKKSSDSSSSSESDADQSPGTEYLRNVGHSVAAMLDPLGIDVEVDVETHGQRRRCRRGMRGHGTGPWWHGMRGGPLGMRGRFACHPRGPPGRWCGVPPAWCTAQPAGAAAAGPQQSTAAPQPTQSQNVPAADTNAETGEMAVGQHEASPPDQSWMLVNDCGADVESAATGVEQLHVSADVEPTSPDGGGVDRAVEQMMSMGYGNEGGWLTQLLVAHHGDIGRALDAIHANK